MAAIQGSTGVFSAQLTAVELVIHVREWTIDSIGSEFNDITQFSGTDILGTAYEEVATGLSEITGSFRGFADVTRSGGYVESTLNATTFAAILTASTSRTYTFQCGFPSIEFEIEVGKPILISGTFKSQDGTTPVFA